MQMQKKGKGTREDDDEGLITRSLALSSKRRFQEPLREERKAISRDGEASGKGCPSKGGRKDETYEGGREGGVKGNGQIVKRRQWQIKVDGAKAGLSEAAWES